MTSSISSSEVTSPAEKCIYLSASGDTISLCVINGSKFKVVRYYYECDVEVEGSVYIEAFKLDSMIKTIPSGGVVSFEVADSLITITANMYGAVSESVFHNQNAFLGFYINKLKTFNNLLEGADDQLKLLSCLSKSSYSGDVFVRFRAEQGLSMYCQLYTGAYIKLFSECECVDFEGFLYSSYSSFYDIGKDINIGWSVSPNALRIESSLGKVTVLTNNKKSNYVEAVDWAINLASSGSVSIDTSDVLDALTLQSYENKEGGILISCDDTNLILQGNKLKTKQSEIPFESKAGYEYSIGVYTEALVRSLRLLKSLGNSKVKFTVKIAEENEDIKLLCIKGEVGEIVLYERVVLEK